MNSGHNRWSCKFLCKVTKMKANHNDYQGQKEKISAVSSYAKLLKWKQITTALAALRDDSEL